MTAFLLVVALAALAGAWITRRPVLELALLTAAVLAALTIDAESTHPVVAVLAVVVAGLWAWRLVGWADRLAETEP